MARLLKFFAIFLGTALAIFLLVFGLNRDALLLVFENRQALADGSEWVEKTYSMNGLAEYAALHPDMVSLHSRGLEPDEEEIRLQADERRPMGMLATFFLLTGYAEAFERNEMDPDEAVPWSDIENYQLPRIGDSLLRQAQRQAAGESGRSDTVRLEKALALLPATPSPALFDYLLMRLGQERLQELIRRLDARQTDLPVPISGLLLTLAPSLQQMEFDILLRHWQQEPRESFEAETFANSRAYAYGDNRNAWQQSLQKNRLGLDFAQQRDLLTLHAMTSAAEMTRLVARMLRGELLSESISRQVENWISYPVGETPLRQHFSRYGALYDSRIGLLSGIDFGQDHEGNTRVQAIFFDRIHLAVWFHLSSNHMHQNFLQRIIWDDVLFQTLKQASNESHS